MQRAEIESEIIRIVADSRGLDVTGITGDTRLDSLDIESLDIVVIVHEIEDRWKLEVPNDALNDITTVGDIVQAVSEKTGA